MGLAVACGSIFVGVSTLTAWGLWSVRRLRGVLVDRHAVRGRPDRPKELVMSPAKGRLARKLLRAGYRGPGARAVVVGLRLVGLTGACAVAWVGFHQGLPLVLLSAAAVAVAAAGWLLPEWWLSTIISKRSQEITRYVPDMLDLLVICLEAGLGLNAALVRIAKELRWTSSVLSDELEHTNREITMGRPRPMALRNLGQRCGHEDFHALLAVIIQSEKFGMSLAKTLRIQVEAMRTKRRQKLQEAVHKVPVKMVFPLVFFIFPELLAVILGPAAIHIWQYYLKALAH